MFLLLHSGERILAINADQFNVFAQAENKPSNKAYYSWMAVHKDGIKMVLTDAPYNFKKNAQGAALKTDSFDATDQRNFLNACKRNLTDDGSILARINIHDYPSWLGQGDAANLKADVLHSITKHASQRRAYRNRDGTAKQDTQFAIKFTKGKVGYVNPDAATMDFTGHAGTRKWGVGVVGKGRGESVS
jgi:hypothetical protein